VRGIILQPWGIFGTDTCTGLREPPFNSPHRRFLAVHWVATDLQSIVDEPT
jgi:hypothetical protein